MSAAAAKRRPSSRATERTREVVAWPREAHTRSGRAELRRYLNIRIADLPRRIETWPLKGGVARLGMGATRIRTSELEDREFLADVLGVLAVVLWHTGDPRDLAPAIARELQPGQNLQNAILDAFTAIRPKPAGEAPALDILRVRKAYNRLHPQKKKRAKD